MTVQTYGYKYTYTAYNVNETKAIIFAVFGHGGAHIGLFPTIYPSHADKEFYEIGIGQNSTFLRKFGEIGPKMKEIPQGHSLELGQMFWLSWEDNKIALGHGEKPGNNTIFLFEERDIPLAIHHLAFSSNDSWHTWKYYDGM